MFVAMLSSLSRAFIGSSMRAMQDYTQSLSEDPYFTSALLMSIVIEETQKQVSPPVISRPIWESARR